MQPTDTEEKPLLYIWIPNGRDKRRQFVGLRRAKLLLAVPFEQYRLLGGYAAINNSSEDSIEAYIRPTGRLLTRFTLIDLPGVEIIEAAATVPSTAEEGDTAEETIESNSKEGRAIREGARWRLRIKNPRHPSSIEFSAASDAFVALSSEPRTVAADRRPTTLKILGINTPRHDEALRQLEYISSTLFDLDLCYGIQ